MTHLHEPFCPEFTRKTSDDSDGLIDHSTHPNVRPISYYDSVATNWQAPDQNVVPFLVDFTQSQSTWSQSAPTNCDGFSTEGVVLTGPRNHYPPTATNNPVPVTPYWPSVTYGFQNHSYTSAEPSIVHTGLDVSVGTSTNDVVRCCWGIFCNFPLQDVSPSGITRHLRQFHFDDGNNAWQSRKRGVCQWWEQDKPCNQEMFFASYGTHIASVHLRSTSQQCPYCRCVFSRLDSLLRHLKGRCTQQPPQ
ncbi:hypothetical protein AcV5_010509 [Taiwanofungus camphoratus]|nr:hypothetical protein AcV5_010509 [Antrodia cinnamomea]